MINARHSVTPAEPLTASATWMPEGPGKWSRPLRFLPDNEGWVELMRLDPGVRLGLHRHTGEIHAYNLQGRRRLCTGEIVGPGDYVHEQAGNVDWWEAIGDEPLVLFVVVRGAVEYLDARGQVVKRITTTNRKAEVEHWKQQSGVVEVTGRREAQHARAA